jgi:hypothetical protein
VETFFPSISTTTRHCYFIVNANLLYLRLAWPPLSDLLLKRPGDHTLALAKRPVLGAHWSTVPSRK